jgi:dTDP-4-dehydrorhamnose 3,5-epimerase
MHAIPTDTDEILILEPKLFGDARGFFYESFNARVIAGLIGSNYTFVQDNHSRSAKNVLRGLHYQIQQPQGKLIRVTYGEIFDVAVDIRRSSPTFGRWVGSRLSADNHRMLWIPPGFAHGFLVLSEAAEVVYKVTDYYAPAHERTILWSDPDIGITWPLSGPPTLSTKDQAGVSLRNAEVFP